MSDSFILVQSDLTVQFLANTCRIQEKLIEVNFTGSDPLIYQHFSFTIQSNGSHFFERYSCMNKTATKCKAVIMIPKTAQPGLRLTLYIHSESQSCIICLYSWFVVDFHLADYRPVCF